MIKGGIMKNVILLKRLLISVVAMVLLSPAAQSSDLEKPNTVDMLPSFVYSPVGFDDNDNAQIVFEGFYPNTCYRAGLTYYNVDQEKKVIKIINQAYFHPKSVCAMVIIPYKKVINLGLLKEGKYSVQFRSDESGQEKYYQLSNLQVVQAGGMGQDNFLYLPIESAYIVKNHSDGYPRVVVKGHFKTSCMSFDKAVVQNPRGSNTLVVLPIAKLSNKNCEQINKEFSYSIKIPYKNMGRVMIHIRSLNGQAANLIEDLY